MKKTITAHLCYSTDAFQARAPFYFWPYEFESDSTRIYIRAIEIEVDIPDDFDPRPQQIKALEEKQREAAAAFSALTTEIKRQISELQALEFAPAETS